MMRNVSSKKYEIGIYKYHLLETSIQPLVWEQYSLTSILGIITLRHTVIESEKSV